MDTQLDETKESIFSVHDTTKVGCLPNHKIVAWFQTALYFASVLLGLCVAIPIGILLRNFDGTCLLYSQLVWEGTFLWPYSDASCDFIMYTAIGLCMFYALIMGFFYVLLLLKRKAPRYKNLKYTPFNEWNQKFVMNGMNPVLIFINAIATILVLSVAAIITAGLDHFCQWMTEAGEKMDLEINECRDAETAIDWAKVAIYGGSTQGVKGDNFFSCVIVALLASWILTGVWTLQLILNVALTCRRCSCDIAEEKRKPDSRTLMAHRRSGIATPLNRTGGTPGGMTPQYGQPYQPPPQRSFQLQQPPHGVKA